MPKTYIALLRGINVGGKHRVAMKDLIEIFERAGCGNVKTYIQSGNVIFTASAACARSLPEAAGTMSLERFGFRIPVVVRTTEQLRRVVGNNPFLAQGADPDTLHVLFLDELPEADRAARLNPDRSPPDKFRLVGQDIYLHLFNGVADCKLTNAYFDSALKTICTGRNWRTVLKLLEMAEE